MTIIDDIKTWVAETSKTSPYLCWDDVVDYFGGTVLESKIVGTTRWETLTDIITAFGDDETKVYVCFRERAGSTEMQESDSLHDQLRGNSLVFVKPVEVTSIEYVLVN